MTISLIKRSSFPLVQLDAKEEKPGATKTSPKEKERENRRQSIPPRQVRITPLVKADDQLIARLENCKPFILHHGGPWGRGWTWQRWISIEGISFVPFYLQNPSKKTVVLSGEAMKEMQKQVKANKDERRLTVRQRNSVQPNQSRMIIFCRV